MLNSIYTSLIRRKLCSVRIINPCYHLQQLHPFSSVISKPISDSKNQDSPMEHYLVNTFGFSPEKAATNLRYFKNRTSSIKKAELVKSFLENQGLSAHQIGVAVRFYPSILLSDPQKTLLPKVEFFQSLGISQTEIKQILFRAPKVFDASLTKKIMPSFSYIKTLFELSGTSFSFSNRLGFVLSCDLESELIPNVEILRDAGVPDSNIVRLLQMSPRVFMVDTKTFNEAVEEVRQMNICPSKHKFIATLSVLRSVSKSVRDSKVAAFKKWGCSEGDVSSVFQRFPNTMMISADNITRSMNFLVKEMGLDSSLLLKNPVILSLSLEKRIKPRCAVYKVLMESGLVQGSPSLESVFKTTEDRFLNKFVHPYKTQAPGLLQLYHQKMGV